MRPYQTLRDDDNYQVALFPLESFVISQADTEHYSHKPTIYWATDYLAYNTSGQRITRANCYAPVDLKLLWMDRSYPVAVWESLEKVHLANGVLDYLTVLVYHDNDIYNGLYSVGDIKRQGEVFNKTGTINHGETVGDHVHLETGRGKYKYNYSTKSGTAEYKYHITNYTTVKRLHNYDALFINDTIPRHTSQYPTQYPWKTFEGGHPSPTPSPSGKRYKFKWVLYANKIRNR